MATTIEPAEGTPLVYQCALPLSRQTLTFVVGLLRARLKKIGSRWRKLPPGKIALTVLATLRHDHRLAVCLCRFRNTVVTLTCGFLKLFTRPGGTR